MRSGFVYEIAGGAPEYVSNYAAIGGARPCTNIDVADITNADQGVPWNHLHVYPTDGTLVCVPGFVYEIAGGAPEYVSNYAAIGGARPARTSTSPTSPTRIRASPGTTCTSTRLTGPSQ